MTPWRFVQAIRRLATQGPFCLIQVDYDHTAAFLNHYGLAAVDAAARAGHAVLVRHLARACGGPERCHDSSGGPDEVDLACPGTEGEVLPALRRGLAEIPAAAGLRLPVAEVAFGCTASLAPHPPVATGEVDGVLRALCRANQEALGRCKAYPALRGRAWPLPAAGSAAASRENDGPAARVWRALDDFPGWGAGEAAPLVPPALLPQACAPAAGELACVLISPGFRGTAFERRLGRLDGGLVRLPDGSYAGKLGFLNRLFGEHLTPNVVMEHVTEALVRMCPWRAVPGAALTRMPSGVCGVGPVDLLGRDLGELVAWLSDSAAQVRATFGGLLTVPAFRVALLPAVPGVVERVLSLSRHVFQVAEAAVAWLPCGFLFDYRRTSEQEFERVVDRYRHKALRLAGSGTPETSG
jgi:hypothetical protein